MEEESWFVEEALPGDVFTPAPEALWESVLRRKGPSFHLLSTMPVDPTSN
jgi:putative transcriptional regulator